MVGASPDSTIASQVAATAAPMAHRPIGHSARKAPRLNGTRNGESSRGRRRRTSTATFSSSVQASVAP